MFTVIDGLPFEAEKNNHVPMDWLAVYSLKMPTTTSTSGILIYIKVLVITYVFPIMPYLINSHNPNHLVRLWFGFVLKRLTPNELL